MPVLWVVVFVVVLFVVLAGLYWVGTLTVQGYWYSEAASGLYWRAPAAAAAVALFVGLWCFVNFRFKDPARDAVPYGALWQWNFTEDDPPGGFPFFVSVKKGKATVYVQQPPPVDYQGRRTGGAEYVDRDTRKPWRTGDAEGLVEEVRIPYPDPEKPDDPTAFKTVDYKLVPPAGGRPEPGKSLTYRSDDGRTITELDVTSGTITRWRWDLLFGYALLNVLLLGVLFAGLWLLLRYQWSHALGLAALLFLVLTLGVFPPLFSMVKDAAPKETTTPKKLVPPAPKTRGAPRHAGHPAV